MSRIFTFWEPKSNMPGYIKQCLQTWRRYCPDSEIIVLDYQNLNQYLDESEITSVLCKKMTLAMQSDCIRCAILYRYGGIWMDADTILTQQIGTMISQEKCTFIGRGEFGAIINYGAFIMAPKAEDPFIAAWHRQIQARVKQYSRFFGNPILRIFHRDSWRIIRKWDYCVNAIIDPLANSLEHRKFHNLIERDKICAMPEFLFAGTEMTAQQRYVKYWFSPGDINEVLSRSGGIILLHNSWTPQEYRQMDAETFMNSDIRLACLMNRVLT